MRRPRGTRTERILMLAVVVTVLAGTSATSADAGGGRGGSAEELMERVFRWELRRMESSGEVPGPDWKQAVFIIGVTEAHEVTGSDEYLKAAEEWSDANEWRPGPRPRHADDHCAAQVYLTLRGGVVDSKELTSTRETFDAMVAEPGAGREEWSWCDALFMAPPAMAALSEVTGDGGYVELMDEMWWDSHDLLYDAEERLFHRDEKTMRRRDGSVPRTWRGNKLMWSRGNGWVLAGLARVLRSLPRDFETRPRYERLFCSMARRVADLQGEGGLWGSALLDPMDSQPPESSGSALFCYALGWGVREGLLDAETCMPVIERAWSGLTFVVNDEGRVGWVQRPGTGPAMVAADHSEVYGSGAFLLAAAEVLRLEREGLMGVSSGARAADRTLE